MHIIKTVDELNKIVKQLKESNKQIGFVPTMGALHNGHLQLVKRSVSENDVTCVSVFVNPTQFNDKKDLERYPRTLEADALLLKSVGCNYVFAPEAHEMYNDEEMSQQFDFDFEGLDLVMEGKFRPGHFNGVVQVVSKLFNFVQPDKAYFGEKDFQQLAIIRLMTTKLNFPIEIIGCPIVREESGLAMSSRNMLLSEDQQKSASHIYTTLKASTLQTDALSINDMMYKVTHIINANPQLKVEYFEIVNGDTLQPITNWTDADYIVGCITVFCGKVRLIDNIRYK